MNNDEHDARIAVLERAFLELLTEFRIMGLIKDTSVDAMIERMTSQTKNTMEAIFLYSLFHQFRNSPRMQVHARGIAEMEEFFAKREREGG